MIVRMSTPAYRTSYRAGLLFTGIILAGIAGVITTVILTTDAETYRHMHWVFIVLLLGLPMIAAIVIAVIVDRRITRRRREGIAAWLTDGGFDVTLKPNERDRAAVMKRLEPWLRGLDLRIGAEGVIWAAFRNVPGGGQELVGEYRFITGGGRSAQEHIRMFAVVPDRWPEQGGTPGGWSSAVVITRRTWARRGPRAEEIQDADFAALHPQWAIYGDAPTARRILGPRFAELLPASPKKETWCIGGPELCCGCFMSLDAANFAVFLDRVRRAAN